MNEYKRLTIQDEYGDADIFGVDSELLYENLSLSETIALTKVFNRLAELEDKIEQGLLIELPCKVGDTIFFVYEFGSDVGECFGCDKGIVDGISHQEDGIWVHARYESGLTYWHKEDDIGKTVFFTKEEAEAKLQELKGEQK